MKKEIADLWCKALRSGEYKQAKHALARYSRKGEIEGYCCLGVLTALAPPECRLNSLDMIKGSLSGYSENTSLNSQVIEWAGMKTSGDYPNPVDEETPRSLMLDNDSTHTPKSFSELADIIEKNWEAL